MKNDMKEIKNKTKIKKKNKKEMKIKNNKKTYTLFQ